MMDSNIKVSVIIPIYNMEKYLPECLDSIICQTLQEIEIIAVNDGSTDNSLSILKTYQNSCDKLQILNQKNQGAGPARNNGINHSNGKYLIFIDPDDYYASDDCLETLYITAERERMPLCAGQCIVNTDGNYKKRIYITNNYSKSKYTENSAINSEDYPTIYGHQRILFSAELIKNNHIYFPAYRRFQDPPFTVKAIGCAKKIYEIDKVVYVYRMGHKKVNHSLETCIDKINGIKDVFQLVTYYGLKSMYINCLMNISEKNCVPVYKYGFRGIKEIDDAINQINNIRMQQNFVIDENIFIKEKVQQFVESCREEYQRIYSLLNSKTPILLYGAGEYASAFLDVFHDCLDNILGIAVSNIKESSAKAVLDFKVRQIEDYEEFKDGICVIIVTADRYQNEIEQNLNRLGFQNIIKPHMEKIRPGEELVKSIDAVDIEIINEEA